MERAFETHHFNSFRIGIPGIGGGTFHALHPPELRGFTAEDPEYRILLRSYGGQLQEHLREKGWLDRAFIYWFDEPSPDQYAFVQAGFDRLKDACPDIARMLTEQIEPALIGGPDIWCSLTSKYDHDRASERRRHGERLWWYVCTQPKAPHAGLFIDHPAPEMRIWLWQTFKRGIDGILAWQTNYWTSGAAYPDARAPQDPYQDPMSWMSGYSTPDGKRRPWGNGDGRLLYPPPAAVDFQGEGPILGGPVGSIRLEHLRDGIEDYEYLCILRRRLRAKGESLSEPERRRTEKLLDVPESITASLTDFAADGAPIEIRRHEIALAILALR
jgi:glycosyl hydrolase family 123